MCHCINCHPDDLDHCAHCPHTPAPIDTDDEHVQWSKSEDQARWLEQNVELARD